MQAMENSSNDALADELVLISVKLVRRLRAMDPSPVLSPAESSALAVLIFAGDLTLGELARYEGVKAPTMTRLVQNLEQRDVIRRVRDSNDARIFRVSATTPGKKLFAAGQKRRLQPLIRKLALLTDAERASLVKAMPSLRKIADVGD